MKPLKRLFKKWHNRVVKIRPTKMVELINVKALAAAIRGYGRTPACEEIWIRHHESKKKHKLQRKHPVS